MIYGVLLKEIEYNINNHDFISALKTSGREQQMEMSLSG